MIKIENVEVYGFEAAIRGMRNPLNSWNKSDSYWTHIEDEQTLETAKYQFHIGETDLNLMTQLSRAGNDHGKFLRMITVTVDITAPLYWWKEHDQYKISVTTNSCSTMHKIQAKEFTYKDFSIEHLNEASMLRMKDVIYQLNRERQLFNETGDKEHWWQMIQLLPSSYNQKRTVQLNYQVLKSMYHARKTHKLNEWREFCAWCETLPYFKEICIEM